MIPALILCCALLFFLGVCTAFLAKHFYVQLLGPWLRDLMLARARRPAYRAVVLRKAWRVASEVQTFGSTTGDAECKLLGFVLVGALAKVTSTPEEKLESMSKRMGALRDAADAVGAHYEDKWWRAGQRWSEVRVNEIVRKALAHRARRDATGKTRP